MKKTFTYASVLVLIILSKAVVDPMRLYPFSKSGSFFFLEELITDLELEYDIPACLRNQHPVRRSALSAIPQKLRRTVRRRSLYDQIDELDQLIAEYKPKKTDELILKDRKWTEITGLATRIYESASRWLLAEA